MRIGWLVDDPGYMGGAEMTMCELAAAKPDNIELVACPPGHVVAGCDLYVVGNCMLYTPADKPDGKIVRIIHDERGPGPIDSPHRIFYSPLSRDRVGLPGELCPAPLDPVFHPNGNDRDGNVHVGTFGNPGKGQRQLNEWGIRNGGLVLYGHGPFLPSGPGIEYRGVLTPDQVPEVLQHAERFVHLPTAVEGYGRAVAEAWACGCEIVANRNVGCLYWLENDPDAITTAAERFWEITLSA